MSFRDNDALIVSLLARSAAMIGDDTIIDEAIHIQASIDL